MLETTHQLQIISLTLALAGIAGWVLWGICTKKYWLFVITAVSWLAHVVIFYIVAIWRYDNGITVLNSTMTQWSSVIKLHGVVLLTGCGLILAILSVFDKKENSWIHRLLS